MSAISHLHTDKRHGFRLSRGWRIAASAVAVTGLMLACAAAEAAQDSSSGRLTISLTLKGSGKHVLPNKIEWSRLKVERRLDVSIAMERSAIDMAPIVTVGGMTSNDVQAPKGMQAIASAMEACGEDESCRAKAMLGIGMQLKNDPGALGALKLDKTRFVNWTARQGADCATGEISVSDEGDGVNIAPPSPAAPYRFSRSGSLSLPADAAIMDAVCKAIVTVDQQSGLASLRFPGDGIPVAVRLSGQAFTQESSVSFREGSKELELHDQKVDLDDKSWHGSGRIAKAGSVSHNSGSTVAPVSATVTWRFVQD